MERVIIRFSNIQSHENTSFTLEPGLNFILANDNNVGKSTIFKVLMTIAKAPDVTPARLKTLLRIGCTKAYAAFDYSDGRVVAWIQKDDNRVPHLFFEHIDNSGETIRSLSAPKSLIDALGIVIDKEGNLVNFNDADSVQLISKRSAEADSILTSVILDATVEQVKGNLYRFNKDLESEVKIMTVKKEDAEEALTRLTYNVMVDDYFDNLPLLQAMCALCDDMPVVDGISTEHNLEETEKLQSCRNLLSDLSSCLPDITSYDTILSESVQVYADILREDLHDKVIGFLRLEDLKGYMEDLRVFRDIIGVISKASKCAWMVVDQRIAIERGTSAMLTIREDISRQSMTVDCPVKGKVLFSDEKCIPYSN